MQSNGPQQNVTPAYHLWLQHMTDYEIELHGSFPKQAGDVALFVESAQSNCTGATSLPTGHGGTIFQYQGINPRVAVKLPQGEYKLCLAHRTRRGAWRPKDSEFVMHSQLTLSVMQPWSPPSPQPPWPPLPPPPSPLLPPPPGLPPPPNRCLQLVAPKANLADVCPRLAHANLRGVNLKLATLDGVDFRGPLHSPTLPYTPLHPPTPPYTPLHPPTPPYTPIRPHTPPYTPHTPPIRPLHLPAPP